MALANSALLRPQSALQQLLEEINFQRTKEMRQLLKDDGGFVVLQGTTYWTDLFVRHFLFQTETEQNIDSDDLLFFVRKKHVKGSSRHMPKYETDVDVYRKDSRKLPIGDPDVDWEETVYLNLIIHQFNYTLTLAICTRTSPKELQVLRRHSQRVYASPSRRKMDTKGDGEEMTFPHICFMVDNFDEVFGDIMVRDGEMVCVELVANDRDGTVQGVIFLGSIRYDALKKVYDARQSSISSKLAQRMTFGLFSSGGPQTRCEFVRMKGPQGKGHAEMAVTKPKGSGIETPTSEPGFCATDMMDEWDEDPDDFLNYRHQRRLSDPSANLNNYSRYGWKTKGTGCGEQSSKARSENEGLDSLASEVSEIEAGDLKDDRSALSSGNDNNVPSNRAAKSTKNRRDSSVTKPRIATQTTTCCNCFGTLKMQRAESTSGQMSEVYCRMCDDDVDSPACLMNVSGKARANSDGCRPKHKTILTVESELEMTTSKISISTQKSPSHIDLAPSTCNDECRQASDAKHCINAISKQMTECETEIDSSATGEEYELADDAIVCDDDRANGAIHEVRIVRNVARDEMIRVQGKEELPVTPEEQVQCNIFDNNSDSSSSSVEQLCERNPSKQPNTSHPNATGPNHGTNLSNDDISPTNKTEENDQAHSNGKLSAKKVNCTDNHPLLVAQSSDDDMCGDGDGRTNTELNGHGDLNGNDSIKLLRHMHRIYSTLPKAKKATAMQKMIIQNDRLLKSVPTRITPDGTTIYYWCDLPKQSIKELDDGAYNPLWTTKGFTQTFHFWKEHRRQQSTPLNAFLTYVTLPWWSIAKDLLDHRETPILTF